MTFDQAVATVRARQLLTEDVEHVVSVLMAEGLRYQKALRFYANEKNYLDGAALLENPLDGLLTEEDAGHTAREALRVNDHYGAIILRPGMKGATNDTPNPVS